MFRWRRKVREGEDWDISQIVPKVEILNQVQDDGIAGQARNDEMPDQVRHDGGARDDDFVERFSVDLEERLMGNMRRAKEDASMLEKIINNKL